MNYKNIRVIVFDFDGVIVDSEGAKRAVWYELLQKTEDPNGFSWSAFNHDALVKDAHRVWVDGTSKGSRYEMIEYMMDQVKYPKTKEAIQWYAEAYNNRVQEAIALVGVSKETRQALEILSTRYPLYVNSGTPEEALKESIRALRIEHYFKRILGKTDTKKENSKMENIKIAMGEEHATPADTLFIGDAIADYKAAQEVGCLFIRFSAFDPIQKKWELEAPESLVSLTPLVTALGL